MREPSIPDLDALARKAHDAIESGDPSDSAKFSRETGMTPSAFTMKLEDEGLESVAQEVGRWTHLQSLADTVQLPSPMLLEHQHQWDEAVVKGSRRAALRALYTQLGVEPVDYSIDRGGAHDAPGATDAPMWDVCGTGTFPEDFYSAQGLRYYGTGDEVKDAQAYEAIRSCEGHPNKSVVVYRAVEKDSPHKKINPGDWVTPVRSYAVDHGRGALSNDYRIMSKTVTAKDLYCDGNSLLEWGYHPQERFPTFSKWKEIPFIAHVARFSRETPSANALAEFLAGMDEPLSPLEQALAADLTFGLIPAEQEGNEAKSYWVRSSLLGGATCALVAEMEGQTKIVPYVRQEMLQGINGKAIQAAFSAFLLEQAAESRISSTKMQSSEHRVVDSPALGM